ncbi:hypothetical protein EGI11_03780 [Chryseobacterium sp. H3056]|uniref:Uncharacterized protein n=1 Tax=Kaistella daneshvariae TaxID=2487074 RepID=A0A3N0WXP0_9FLAO|nr:hypothetical protein EGI11_03780 [Kaistella daneshvariae]
MGRFFIFEKLIILAASFLFVHSWHHISRGFLRISQIFIFENLVVLAASFLREKSGNVSREFFWN